MKREIQSATRPGSGMYPTVTWNECPDRYTFVKGHVRRVNGNPIYVEGYCKKLGIGQHTKDERKRLQRHHYRKGDYRARVFHPLAFEDQVFAVNITKQPNHATDKNTFFTQEEASSSREAYMKALNSREFKQWEKTRRDD